MSFATNQNDLKPPIVLECPECGEQYLISQNIQPSEEAMLFSDGFFTDTNTWRTPRIIGCVTCELGFFPAAGKLIATPNWSDFNAKWSHLKKASPPTAGALVLELRVRKNLNIDQEIAIRTELWYATNHTTKGQELLSKNEKFKAFCIQSLNKLETLIQPVNTENHK